MEWKYIVSYGGYYLFPSSLQATKENDILVEITRGSLRGVRNLTITALAVSILSFLGECFATGPYLPYIFAGITVVGIGCVIYGCLEMYKLKQMIDVVLYRPTLV